MTDSTTNIAIVGGGIGGLALALHLHRCGLSCDVYEAQSSFSEVGVGINLLPHAMRELAAVGLADAVVAAGIENDESVFCNRHGQLIYRELRGRRAGYPMPDVGVDRAKFHRILWDAVVHRLGVNRVHTGHRFVKMHHGDDDVALSFTDPQGRQLPGVRARLVVAADGVNSAIRRIFYPDDPVVFTGINTWRGVTRHPPILDGRSFLRIGSINSGKMAIFPIAKDVDGKGMQLIHWVAEVASQREIRNDWTQSGRAEDVLPWFKSWQFDWLDVPNLIASSDTILQYPMVDKDPIPQWTFGRVTLLGDAAHPMYPRGANGSAQALVDARTLADELARTPSGDDPLHALYRYETVRKLLTSKVLSTNRNHPPDFINIKVEELTQGRPFQDINDVISQSELRKISDDYKQGAGFASVQMPRTP